MGHAMATNLVKAGHEVTVWNRTPGKLVEGAGVAPTPAAAAQGAEVVWLCVSDTDAVESVIFGADGVEASLTEGTIIADSSTISPTATVKFAERVGAKGVSWVDAPMTGSKIGARDGTLVFIVGGVEEAVERLKPLFAAMGKKIFRMGETGKGQATKLAMNLQIAMIFEGFAEALTLATKLGVDPQQLLSLIEATMVRSGVVDYKGALYPAARLHAEFSAAADAQGYSADAGGSERSACEIAGAGNGGRDLRDGVGGWEQGSRLCRDIDPAGEVGGRAGKRKGCVEDRAMKSSVKKFPGQTR